MAHALRHGGAPLPNFPLHFTTVSHQGQNKDSRGQFPGSGRRYKGPNMKG